MKKESNYRENLKQEYDKRLPLWRKCESTISSLIEDKLKDGEIDIVDIEKRVKDFSSFHNKIERNGYQKDPFVENTDFVGIRIITKFISDLDQIDKVICKTFDLINSFRKEDRLKPDQFGYRSNHYIISVDKIENGFELNNLTGGVCEIQVRTILMHSWAMIEHKLAYKSDAEIPRPFRRKFSRISALLEVSDEIFQSLNEDRDRFIHDINEELRRPVSNNTSLTWDLDTLLAFLKARFPLRKENISFTQRLLKELLLNKLSIIMVDRYLKSLKQPTINKILNNYGGYLSRPASLRMILDILDDDFYESRTKTLKNMYGWNLYVRSWKSSLRKV